MDDHALARRSPANDVAHQRGNCRDIRGRRTVVDRKPTNHDAARFGSFHEIADAQLREFVVFDEADQAIGAPFGAEPIQVGRQVAVPVAAHGA
jgi:hypothetical protein